MSTTKSTGDLPFETALVFERRWTLVLLNRTFAMLRFEHEFVGKLLRVASLPSALTPKRQHCNGGNQPSSAPFPTSAVPSSDLTGWKNQGDFADSLEFGGERADCSVQVRASRPGYVESQEQRIVVTPKLVKSYGTCIAFLVNCHRKLFIENNLRRSLPPIAVIAKMSTLPFSRT